MDINDIRAVMTVVMFITFIGIWAWAWSDKRKRDFEEAANLPFLEDDEPRNAMEVTHHE